MAKAVTPLDDAAIEAVAQWFRALGEPLRLRLLQLIVTHDCSVGELAQLAETTQPNVSKHLRSLQQAGIVERRQDGNSVFYTVADVRIFDVCSIICSSINERVAAQTKALAQNPYKKASSRLKRKQAVS